MTRPSIKTTLPFDVLLGPDYDVLRGLLEAFPGYVLSSNESKAEGVVYIGDEELSVQIALRSLPSDIDKRLLLHVWDSLGANAKNIEETKDSVKVTGLGFLESMGCELSPRNLNRVRDSANRIARSGIVIEITDADGLTEETWMNCFEDLKIISEEGKNSLLIGLLPSIISCSLAPKRKHCVH